MTELGYNYRITDFQCALGLSQLAKLDAWTERRRALAHKYSAALAPRPEVEVPTLLPDRESAWHLYVMRLRLDSLKVDRACIVEALRAET